MAMHYRISSSVVFVANGNVVETIELNGRWKIIIGEKSYFMTNRYVDEMKVDLEKIQKNFMDNL